MERRLPKEGLGTPQSVQLVTQITEKRVSFMQSVENRIRFWENEVNKRQANLQQRQLALALGKLRMSRQGKQALCCHAWRYENPDDDKDSAARCAVCGLTSDQFDEGGKFKGEELDYSGVDNFLKITELLLSKATQESELQHKQLQDAKSSLEHTTGAPLKICTIVMEVFEVLYNQDINMWVGKKAAQKFRACYERDPPCNANGVKSYTEQHRELLLDAAKECKAIFDVSGIPTLF